jgi:hypothetical protein
MVTSPRVSTGPYWSGTFTIFSCIGTSHVSLFFRVACVATSCMNSPKDGRGGDVG